MKTPSVKICALDPASGLCSGCGRSLDEIASWLNFSEEERGRILRELPGRMKQFKPD